MIIIPLPFSLAKNTRVNINTFEREYANHPVLEIGSSTCRLKEEVIRWLKEQGIKYTFLFYSDGYTIQFPNDKDATMFCLRWL